jgi:hypothetical protein
LKEPEPSISSFLKVFFISRTTTNSCVSYSNLQPGAGSRAGAASNFVQHSFTRTDKNFLKTKISQPRRNEFHLYKKYHLFKSATLTTLLSNVTEISNSNKWRSLDSLFERKRKQISLTDRGANPLIF